MFLHQPLPVWKSIKPAFRRETRTILVLGALFLQVPLLAQMQSTAPETVTPASLAPPQEQASAPNPVPNPAGKLASSDVPSEACQMAQVAGFHATPAEIVARQNLLQAFGNVQTNPLATECDLASEKLFASIAKIHPSPAWLSSQWDTLSRRLAGGTTVRFEDAKDWLEAKWIQGQPEAQQRWQAALASSRQKQTDKAIAENRGKPSGAPPPPNSSEMPLLPPGMAGMKMPVMEMWTTSEIQIEGYNSQCLALDPATNTCMVDLDAFNQATLDMQFAKQMPLVDARSQVLDKTLNIRWLTKEAQTTGYAKKPEIEQEVAKRTSIKTAGMDQALNPAQLTDSLLRATYKFHYDSLFAPREEVTLQVAASTDSLRVAKIAKLLRDSARDSTVGRRKVRVLPRFPSVTGLSSVFPPEVVRPTDTLQEGQFTVPTRTAWGWFVSAVAKVRRQEEIPFDSARAQVYQLASQGSIGRSTDLRLSEVERYWKQHPDQFHNPDTFQVKAWLVPGHSFPTKIVKKDTLPDTAAVKALVLSFGMPTEVRDSLQSWWSARPSKRKQGDSTSRVFRTKTGSWMLRVTSAKPGVGIVPFRNVQASLARTLARRPGDIAALPLDARQKMVSDENLAMLYWQASLQNTKTPTDDEIKKLIKDGAVQVQPTPEGTPKDVADQMRVGQAREILRDQVWRKPMDAWKGSLRIDNSLLTR